jgi:hypothetical protein
MPKIPEIHIPQIREIAAPNLPSARPVTLELGPPIIEMPGCVPVHPDAKLNPSLLQDDPGRVGAFCPHGQVPSFNPMDFIPNEFVRTTPVQPKATDSNDKESAAPNVPPTLRLPEPNATTPQRTEIPALSKPIIEKVVDGLPSVEMVVTTTTIALVASTSALVAKPAGELILKLIRPTVKKAVKKVAQIRGLPEEIESVFERRISQRDRNHAIRDLRRTLRP